MPILMFLALISSLMIAIDLLNEKTGQEYAFQQTAPPVRVAFAAALVVLIMLGGGSQINAFIYFQF